MSAVANDIAGEITIKLGEKEYVLRPAFSALRKLEVLSSTGIIALTQRLSAMDIRIADVAAVVWAGILGSKIKDPPSYDEIGEMILANGMASYIKPVADFLTKAVTAGRVEGEAKKALETEPTILNPTPLEK